MDGETLLTLIRAAEALLLSVERNTSQARLAFTGMDELVRDLHCALTSAKE